LTKAPVFVRIKYPVTPSRKRGNFMAVPRAKTSKARTGRRHTINMKLSAPTMVGCSSCGNKILLHRACPKCGFYHGKQVIIPDAKS